MLRVKYRIPTSFRPSSKIPVGLCSLNKERQLGLYDQVVLRRLRNLEKERSKAPFKEILSESQCNDLMGCYELGLQFGKEAQTTNDRNGDN